MGGLLHMVWARISTGCCQSGDTLWALISAHKWRVLTKREYPVLARGRCARTHQRVDASEEHPERGARLGHLGLHERQRLHVQNEAEVLVRGLTCAGWRQKE